MRRMYGNGCPVPGWQSVDGSYRVLARIHPAGPKLLLVNEVFVGPGS
jgi:hypothetical protein